MHQCLCLTVRPGVLLERPGTWKLFPTFSLFVVQPLWDGAKAVIPSWVQRWFKGAQPWEGKVCPFLVDVVWYASVDTLYTFVVVHRLLPSLSEPSISCTVLQTSFLVQDDATFHHNLVWPVRSSEIYIYIYLHTLKAHSKGLALLHFLPSGLEMTNIQLCFDRTFAY